MFDTYRLERFDKEPIELGRSPVNLLKDTSLSRSTKGIRWIQETKWTVILLASCKKQHLVTIIKIIFVKEELHETHTSSSHLIYHGSLVFTGAGRDTGSITFI